MGPLIDGFSQARAVDQRMAGKVLAPQQAVSWPWLPVQLSMGYKV